MRKIKGQKGLSLIEVTIMLLVLMLLTGVLAPSIMDFVIDAKWVKVKEDCEAIAFSIARLHRDVGCLKLDGDISNLGCTFSNMPKILYSRGNGPAAANMSGEGTTGVTVNGGATYVWSDVSSSGHADPLEDQLVTNGTVANGPQYVNASPVPGGPWFNRGWRGAYLTPPIGPDPWGNAYVVNTMFLDVPISGVAGCPAAAEGCLDVGWHYDTFCLSSGPNRVYETGFALNGAIAKSDDFITIISGGTH